MKTENVSDKTSKVYFHGSIYEISVRHEGTDKEQVIINRCGWIKPLVLGKGN